MTMVVMIMTNNEDDDDDDDDDGDAAAAADDDLWNWCNAYFISTLCCRWATYVWLQEN